MAKDQQPEAKPKVSKLPLPISDSPLVIDLPDGQKIVVGKMTQGSVIEVATWRGVGRPDSRTSRLMLGVGMGNVQEDSETPEQSSSAPRAPRKPQDWRIVLYYFNFALNKLTSIQWAAIIKKVAKSKPAKSVKKAERSPNTVSGAEVSKVSDVENRPASTASRISSMDDDIEAWLNKISEKAVAKSSEPVKSPQSSAKTRTAPKKVVKKQASAKPKRK